MPQFEMEEVGLDRRFTELARGLSPEDAIRRALDLDASVVVDVETTADLHGWQKVQIDGRAAGRIRPHQRMRFRRD